MDPRGGWSGTPILVPSFRLRRRSQSPDTKRRPLPCHSAYMPLLSLWTSDPQTVGKLSIVQVVANAGDGTLKDNSDASKEFREYLSQVPSERLGQYASQCLSAPFPKSGSALQDIVNELGRRLDYTVENGRYQGVPGGIGFDGIWVSPDGGEIVVEVKTTDVYRISLDTIASYRRKLQESGELGPHASVLIIVGRDDTGELEAQVRGSRHAWDMRLMSVDALISLVKLKENTEIGETGRKIRSVLTPMEYTRLDALVDVMFSTAKDVETAADVDSPDESVNGKHTGDATGWQFTAPDVVVAHRLRIMDALAKREGKAFVKRTAATYWDASHRLRATCNISKRYAKKGEARYWYAYHAHWNEFLGEADHGWVVLGCIGLDRAFAIPVQVVRAQLDKLNATEKPDGTKYWHVKLMAIKPDAYALQLSKTSDRLPIEEYAIPVP